MCRCECPVDQALGKEAVSPTGKARFAHMMLEGQLPWSEEFVEAVYSCVGCKGCETLCPFEGLELAEELRLVRLEAARQGVTLNSVQPYLSNLKKYGSPYGSRAPLSEEARGSKGAEVLVFAGCTTVANNPASLEAILALLDRAGVSYQMVEEYCCGYPADLWGDPELARQLAKENVRLFADSGARKLITNCPECWLTFKRRYPEWEQELPLEVVDGTAFLLEIVREGRLKPAKVEGLEKVAYHDPCVWARYEERTEVPRELLASIPGLKLEEAAAAGKATRCCGGGQMFQLASPAGSEAIARRRLAEFPAGMPIVTDCPFCREGLKVEGAEVLELVELLQRACCGGSGR